MSKSKGDLLAGNGTQKGQDEFHLEAHTNDGLLGPPLNPVLHPGDDETNLSTALPLAFNFIAASK